MAASLLTPVLLLATLSLTALAIESTGLSGQTGGVQTMEVVQPAMEPEMTHPEAALFRKYVANARQYFEYGCGGSTAVAATLGVGCIYSVDTSAEWLQKVREKVSHPCIKMQHIPVGELSKWGRPKTRAKKQIWPLYSAFIGLMEDPMDVVLVDGRFRVACALQAWFVSTPSTIVIIHDFRDRKYYHAVLNFFDVVETADTMVVLKANPEKLVDGHWRAKAQAEIARAQYAID